MEGLRHLIIILFVLWKVDGYNKPPFPINNDPPPYWNSGNYDQPIGSNTNQHVNRGGGDSESSSQNNELPPNVRLSKSFRTWKPSQTTNKYPPFRVLKQTIKTPMLPSPEALRSNPDSRTPVTKISAKKRSEESVESTTLDPSEYEYYYDYIPCNQTGDTTGKVNTTTLPVECDVIVCSEDDIPTMHHLRPNMEKKREAFIRGIKKIGKLQEFKRRCCENQPSYQNNGNQGNGPIEIFPPKEYTTERPIECDYVVCSDDGRTSKHYLPADMGRTEFFVRLEKMDNVNEFKRNCCENQPRDVKKVETTKIPTTTKSYRRDVKKVQTTKIPSTTKHYRRYYHNPMIGR